MQGTCTEQIVSNYSDRFEEFGTLNGGPPILHHDSSMGDTRRHSCVPFMLYPKVKQKLKKLLNVDGIELCEGSPTPVVSLIHGVPKPKGPGELRICVDLRGPNQCINRERYITPTIDDIITELNEATVFSK